MAGVLRDGLYGTELDQHPDAQHPRIAFLHGLFGQGKNWTTIGKQLSEDYAVSLIDMPNHGRSAWTSEITYPAMADQVAAFLTDAGGDRDWALVGHSMGGKIAMTLALRHPRLVSRLCVVDIAPVDYRGQSEFSGYVEAMRSIDLDHLRTRAQADDQLLDQVPSPTVRSFLLQNLRRGEAAPQQNRGGAAPQEDRGWHWQPNLRLLGDQLDVLSGWPDLGPAQFDGPTLWVAGAESDYIKPEYTSAMKDRFPQTRSIKIKDARHWVHSEQPEVFVQVLRRFLSG